MGDGVLERLHATEVDGRLHVLGVATQTVRFDRHRNTGPTPLCFERRRQALVGEERRVNAPGHLAEALQSHRSTLGYCREIGQRSFAVR